MDSSMNSATDFDRQRSDIETARERFIAQRPFLEPILRPYAALCIEKINLAEKLRKEAAAWPAAPDSVRHDQGLYVVNGENAASLKAALEMCWPAMIAVLKRQLPVLAASLSRLETLPLESDLGQLAGGYLSGDAAPVEKIGDLRGVAPGLVNLVLHGALGSVLAWVAANGTSPALGLHRMISAPRAGLVPFAGRGPR